MIPELLQIGDHVIVSIDRESRSWGYDPCANGTRAVVTGFGEVAYGRTQNFGHQPGFYHNKSWPFLTLENGQVLTINSKHVELADQEEYTRRVVAFREQQEQGISPQKQMVRPLPDTPFWEGDLVEYSGKTYFVTRIDYLYLDDLTNFGDRWPAYWICLHPYGDDFSLAETQLTLVSRGKVWLYYHNKPIVFASVVEEAKFFLSLGKADEVRNPNTGDYRWTFDQLIKALNERRVHGYTVNGGLFASGGITAWRFRDEQLGCRLAEATLQSLVTTGI